MLIIGFGQLLAALLLIVSGCALLNAGGWFLPIVDIFAAFWFIWQAFDKIDPPSGDDGVALYI